MNLSPLAVGLIIATFTSFLGLIGWLFNAQISTNKRLSDAITELSKSITGISSELRVAMTSIEERSNNQRTLCQVYRSQIDIRNKGIESRIQKLENAPDHAKL